ncbi:MAG: FAD-dependent monooxygenase [Alphaproteobacteria bacterium]|jgi:2-octaprenyl-6-methoxyphenol hydroxylase
MKNQFDIVIIGGGLVGLSTILSLKEVILNKPSFKVALIEKGNFSKLNALDYDGRTSFIGLGSKAILEEFAVFKEIEPVACKVEKIFAYEEDGSKSKDSLYFSTLFEEKMEMGYIVHNSDLRQKLYEEVKKLDITILENTGVVDFETSEKVVIELDNKKTITANLVLASDGKKSFFANKLNIKKTNYDYKQKAIIFIIKHQNFHEHTAIEKFTKSGPIAILPLSGGYSSGIVWTEETSRADELTTLSPKELETLLFQEIGNLSGKIEIISKISSYPLELSYAKEFYKNRVILVGDSAHAIHPIAGQGFNLSLRDAYKIGGVIKESLKLGLDYKRESVWREFEKKRRLDVMLMIKATTWLNNFFRKQGLVTGNVRRYGLKLFDKISPLKKLTIKYASGESLFNRKI